MRALLAALALASLALLAPAASADHWNNDWGDEITYIGPCYYTDTSCIPSHLCTAGWPPQAVDRVLHCAGRAASNADDVTEFAGRYGWAWLDSGASVVGIVPGAVHDNAQPTVDSAISILCARVWSGFCFLGVTLPDDMPVDDPVGPYPFPLPITAE